MGIYSELSLSVKKAAYVFRRDFMDVDITI